MKKSGKNSKRSAVTTIITMILLGCVIVGGFAYITNREKTKKTDAAASLSEADKILAKDLSKEYPPTPREVVKLYSRVVKVIFGEEITDQQMSDLAKFVRKLYDGDLLANNPEEDYLEQLKTEVLQYQTLKRTVTAYAVEKSENVITFTQDDQECARVRATYTLHDGEVYNKTAEEFIVRKDDKGCWKIIGWRLMDNSDYE